MWCRLVDFGILYNFPTDRRGKIPPLPINPYNRKRVRDSVTKFNTDVDLGLPYNLTGYDVTSYPNGMEIHHLPPEYKWQ